MLNYKKSKELQNKPNPYSDIKTFIKKDAYPSDKLIEIKNLTHIFKNKKTKKIIYENISFEIFANERLAFLGPNGAGKTLTVSTICGYFKHKEGVINYNFKYQNNPYEKISVQFQDLQFPAALTPRDLINFTLKLNDADINDNENEIWTAIKTFDIDQILNTRMSKLSGGQQQRVNVLISLLGKPKILFLDEFTTGLDIAIKNRIQNYILDFCKKNQITLVIISHDIDCIEDMTERIIILADKRIIVDAYSKDIIKEFGSVKNMLKKYIVT